MRLHSAVVCLLLPAIAAAFVLSACEGTSALDEARGEFEAGRYREAVYILRHHVKQGGLETPDHLLLEARCWLRLDAEADAEDALLRAVGRDSSYAPRVAELLHDEAIASMQSGRTARGRRYILRAIGYDSLLDFGGYNAVAGELLLGRKRFGPAVRYLNRFLDQYADTTGAAAVMLNLGEAYEGRMMTDEAIELYRRFRTLYPKSRLNTTVSWKLENLLFTRGEEYLAEGKIEEAEALLVDLGRTAEHTMVREKAFFVLGEINERRADFDRAVQYYTEVINLNLGSSGRLVAQAKERIEKLEDSRKRR